MTDGPRGIGLPKPQVPGATGDAPKAKSESPGAAEADLLTFRLDPSRMERAGVTSRRPRDLPKASNLPTCHNPAEVRLTEAAVRRPALLEPETMARLKQACRRLAPKAWSELLAAVLRQLEEAVAHYPRRLAARNGKLPTDWASAPWYRVAPDRFAAPEPPAQANLRSAAKGLVYLCDLGVTNVRLDRPVTFGPGLDDLLHHAVRLDRRVVVPIAAEATAAGLLEALKALVRALHAGGVGFAFSPDAASRAPEVLTALKIFAVALCPPATVFVDGGPDDVEGRWVGGAWAGGSAGADFVPWPGALDPEAAPPPWPLHAARREIPVPAEPDDVAWRLALAFAAPGTPVLACGAELGAPEGRLGVERLEVAAGADRACPSGLLRDLLRLRSAHASLRSHVLRPFEVEGGLARFRPDPSGAGGVSIWMNPTPSEAHLRPRAAWPDALDEAAATLALSSAPVRRSKVGLRLPARTVAFVVHSAGGPAKGPR